jgi:hypothetical protein
VEKGPESLEGLRPSRSALMGLGILHKQCADKNIGSKAQRNYVPFSSDSSISGVSPRAPRLHLFRAR